MMIDRGLRPRRLAWFAALGSALVFGPVALPPVIVAQATLDVPHPDECVVAPRPLPLLGEPAPGAAAPTPAPLPTRTTFTPPTGAEADADTIAAVSRTIREAIACRNGGDFARAYALMTDHMLVQLFGGPTTIDPEISAALAAAPDRVPKERRLALLAIIDVRMLADQRVGAVVETKNADETFRDYIFFAKDGERWLIDESVPLET